MQACSLLSHLTIVHTEGIFLTTVWLNMVNQGKCLGTGSCCKYKGLIRTFRTHCWVPTHESLIFYVPILPDETEYKITTPQSYTLHFNNTHSIPNRLLLKEDKIFYINTHCPIYISHNMATLSFCQSFLIVYLNSFNTGMQKYVEGRETCLQKTSRRSQLEQINIWKLSMSRKSGLKIRCRMTHRHNDVIRLKLKPPSRDFRF